MPRPYKVTLRKKGISGRWKSKVVNCDPLTGRPNLDTPSQPRPPVTKDSKKSSSKNKIDFSEYDSEPSYKNEITDLSILPEQLLKNSLV